MDSYTAVVNSYVLALNLLKAYQMKILYIEDDIDIRMVVASFIRDIGELDIAVNGEEALRAFDAAWNAGHPYDLVLLDIMIPEPDGQAVLRKIRKFEKQSFLKPCKIIMTTALADEENVKDAFKGGCDSYLAKPFSKLALLDELKKIGLEV